MVFIVIAIICTIGAVSCFGYSFFAFHEKGPILFNDYLFASQMEREKLKTREHYRFIATVFLGVGVTFTTMIIGAVFRIWWMYRITTALATILLIYVVIVSFNSKSSEVE